jgi:pantoate--beta-alanine ligase
MVIKKLIHLIELDKLITTNICPTQREKDGLAMSSRNLRLNREERKKADSIFKALTYINTNFEEETIEKLKQNAVSILKENGFTVDYVEIADVSSLQEIKIRSEKQKSIALVAAFLNEVRLIDNLILN